MKNRYTPVKSERAIGQHGVLEIGSITAYWEVCYPFGFGSLPGGVSLGARYGLETTQLATSRGN